MRLDFCIGRSYLCCVFKFYALNGQLSDSSVTFEAITVVLVKIYIYCHNSPYNGKAYSQLTVRLTTVRIVVFDGN
jgi:hypothetical protein